MGETPQNSDEELEKQADLGYSIASPIREITNAALGDILTMVEIALGDTKQASALKQLVKQRFWTLMDDNQHQVYRKLGVEPYPVLATTEPK